MRAFSPQLLPDLFVVVPAAFDLLASRVDGLVDPGELLGLVEQLALALLVLQFLDLAP